jgi:hypothetical protein
LPEIGERSEVWRFAIRAGALPTPVYGDIVFANKGRTFSVLSLVNLGAPFDPGLARRLTLKAGARLDRYAL